MACGRIWLKLPVLEVYHVENIYGIQVYCIWSSIQTCIRLDKGGVEKMFWSSKKLLGQAEYLTGSNCAPIPYYRKMYKTLKSPDCFGVLCIKEGHYLRTGQAVLWSSPVLVCSLAYNLDRFDPGEGTELCVCMYDNPLLPSPAAPQIQVLFNLGDPDFAAFSNI